MIGPKKINKNGTYYNTWCAVGYSCHLLFDTETLDKNRSDKKYILFAPSRLLDLDSRGLFSRGLYSN